MGPTLAEMLSDLSIGPHGPALSDADLRRWADVVAFRSDKKDLGIELVMLAKTMHDVGAELAMEQLIALAAIALTEGAVTRSRVAALLDASGFIESVQKRRTRLLRLSPDFQALLEGNAPAKEPRVRLTRSDCAFLQRLFWGRGMQTVARSDFGRLWSIRTQDERIRIESESGPVLEMTRNEFLEKLG